MNAHAYAQSLASKGTPLTAISRATGLSTQDIAYLRPKERRSYEPYKPKPVIVAEVIPIKPVRTPEEIFPTPPGVRVFQEYCRFLGVTVADIQGDSRVRPIAWPRQAIMFELYVSCPHLSTPMIGRMLGGRDHTTILHGVSQHAERIGLTYEQAKAMRREMADEMGIVMPAGAITKEERRTRLAAEGRV